ncbi:hypothetical protein A3860_22360 [Niastella vici]|uniref:Glycerophosphoryl diester phosphodiesterase membrane domain-containing protein n=1 Tax=Niastella vici TaxID=1703345 RepID=A0A1V9G0P8_9BACT|nr:DUF6159 family protein [Niastella vici]OQP64152.1 hypothetical protein A3860_22360 [Niastella vici]
MAFSDRISNGWKLAMSSFKILKANQQLILFPILSAISLILVIGSFFTFLAAGSGWDLDNLGEFSRTEYYAVLFIFYVVNYFIVVFFNMALIHCTRLYLNGEEVTLKKGLQFSVSRIGAIFSWAMVAATVGLILKAIQENSGIVGKIVTGIIGLVWSVATFFVVPVIAYENVGPIDAVKRSTQMMKEKWGESLSAGFSFGLIHFLGLLVICLPLFFLGMLIHPIVGIAAAVAAFFVIMAIMDAAKTIFVSAVYHNIKGDVSEHFDQQLIDSLFRPK